MLKYLLLQNNYYLYLVPKLLKLEALSAPIPVGTIIIALNFKLLTDFLGLKLKNIIRNY